jgi:hypothetical protein
MLQITAMRAASRSFSAAAAAPGLAAAVTSPSQRAASAVARDWKSASASDASASCVAGRRGERSVRGSAALALR